MCFAWLQVSALRTSLAIACVALITCATSPCRAIVLSEPSAAHIVAPGVPAFGMNLDGTLPLGRSVNQSVIVQDLLPICTGALISDRHVLTAAHCLDRDEDGEHDFRVNVFPLSAGFETSTGSSVRPLNVDTIVFPAAWPVQNQDIAVIELLDDAPAWIPRYALNNGTDEVRREAVLVGYGATGSGASGSDLATRSPPIKRAGRNRVDAIRGDMPGVAFLAYDFDSGLPENNALALNGFASDLGFGADEALPGTNDSGSPVFIDGRIAGVTSFVARLPGADVDAIANDSWGEAGFATRVANFESFILAATDNAAVFVPEPSVSCHLWGTLCLLVWRRRRSVR